MSTSGNIDPLELKGKLLEGSPVSIDPGLHLPVRTSRSTAGPGAGSRSIALGFRGHRVKVAITRKEKGTLRLVEDSDGYAVLENGKLLASGISILPVLMHAPSQAFIDLETGCRFNCAFCVTPSMGTRSAHTTPERWVELILEATGKEKMDAVALTSGIPRTIGESVEGMLYVVREVRRALETMPIGVEPYLDDPLDLTRFREAGATEIKLNIQTATPALFTKVCPGLDRALIHSLLPRAVRVFGRGRVTSNIIVGMGESDREVEEAIGELAAMGVVPTVRGLRVNDLNRARLTSALGFTPPDSVPAARQITLAGTLGRILEENGLDPRSMETMCHRCGCCDIEPGWDIGV